MTVDRDLDPIREHSSLSTGVIHGQLPVEKMIEWVSLPSCGAIVTFSGVVREYSSDHGGRPSGGVTAIDYEAYAGYAHDRLLKIAEAARARWPGTGRIALLHRVGTVEVGEASVLVCVSAGHRREAFLAAQFCIDIAKACVPIWKLESRNGTKSWVETGVSIDDVATACSVWSPVVDCENS